MKTITFVVLAAAGALFMLRTVRGPSLSARVIGMDGMIVVGVGAIAADAMYRGDGIYLPTVVVITLVGFVSTAASARFIERRELDADADADGDGVADADGVGSAGSAGCEDHPEGRS